MLGVGHVHITDDVNNSAVGFFGQTFVFAAVAGLHVENGDMQTLGTYHGETAVSVTKHQYAVGLEGSEEFVGAVDDVAAGGTKVIAHCIHIDFGLSELKVAEEDAVEVVVVVLAGVGENNVKVLTALVDDGGQADDFRACAHDDAKLQPAVLLPLYVGIICFHKYLIFKSKSSRV